MTQVHLIVWAIFAVAMIGGTVEARRAMRDGHDGFAWTALTLAVAPLGALAWSLWGADPTAEDAADPLSPSRILLVTAAAVVTLVLLSWTASVLERRFDREGRPHAAMIVGRFARLAGLIPLVFFVAAELSWDLNALLAAAGVAGVAVGFAAQTSLSNVIAGAFLLFDRPFSIGDTVEIDGQLGTVMAITMMSTHIRTFENLLVRWPNQDVLQARIINYQRFPTRRVDIVVRYPVNTDVSAARQAILDAIHDHPALLFEPVPDVRLRDVADNGVSLVVRAWVPVDGFLDGRDAVIQGVLAASHAIGVPPMVPGVELEGLPEMGASHV